MPDVLTVTADGEQVWEPTTDVGLYADIPSLTYDFVPLDPGTVAPGRPHDLRLRWQRQHPQLVRRGAVMAKLVLGVLIRSAASWRGARGLRRRCWTGATRPTRSSAGLLAFLILVAIALVWALVDGIRRGSSRPSSGGLLTSAVAGRRDSRSCWRSANDVDIADEVADGALFFAILLFVPALRRAGRSAGSCTGSAVATRSRRRLIRHAGYMVVLVPRQIRMTGITGNVPYYGGRMSPAQAYAASHPAPAPPPPAPAPVAPPREPRRDPAEALQDLLDQGVITQEEHDDLLARARR